MDPVRRTLGKRVRELRNGQQLSQEQVAERADLHWTHISGIERGQYNIGLTTICKVAKGLGVSLSELFEGIEMAHASRPPRHSRR